MAIGVVRTRPSRDGGMRAPTVAYAASSHRVAVMTAESAPKKPPRGPKVWCKPTSAFGKVDRVLKDGTIKKVVEAREWQPPSGRDPVEVAQYRAAVIQNAIAVHAREYKNGAFLSRQTLADLDYRAYSWDIWNARLNGTENLTTADIATLMAVLPEALPSNEFILDFLQVAQGGPRPEDWPYADTCNGTLNPQPLPRGIHG